MKRTQTMSTVPACQIVCDNFRIFACLVRVLLKEHNFNLSLFPAPRFRSPDLGFDWPSAIVLRCCSLISVSTSESVQFFLNINALDWAHAPRELVNLPACNFALFDAIGNWKIAGPIGHETITSSLTECAGVAHFWSTLRGLPSVASGLSIHLGEDFDFDFVATARTHLIDVRAGYNRFPFTERTLLFSAVYCSRASGPRFLVGRG